MATPRIFISSTCYDLQEIRFQMRRFIQEIGYEPIMSEFGDIFYETDKHVHDSCKLEISRSNVFVLIIGNSYGTLYHSQKEDVFIPDSVTLREFREAIDVGIPKYIFINRFVLHDYENYKRSLSKHLTQHFKESIIEDTNIEQVRKTVREQYDNSYPFPQEAYKYIFYFLDIVNDLKTNNAIYPFESFDDIRDMLKKQWAGYFYDSLTKETTVGIEKIDALAKRLERIEHQLRLLAEGVGPERNASEVTIDLKKLTSDFDIADLEMMQDRIVENIRDLLYHGMKPRVEFKEKYNIKKAENLMKFIGQSIEVYKWSKYIPTSEVFIGMRLSYWKNRSEIPYKTLFELYSIFSKLDGNDKNAFLNTICLKLNELFSPEETKNTNISEDDLPF